VPVMGPDHVTNAEKIKKGCVAALAKAVEIKCESLALPAFGTGVGRVPAEESAKAMLEAIQAHAKGRTTLKRIEIVLFDEPTVKAFEDAFRNA